jgi:predicted transcriptional regulator
MLILLMLIFFISYLALTCAPYDHNQLLKTPQLHVEKAAVFASFLFNRGDHAASTLLNQTTRMTVFNFIKDNPGFHFRAISDCLEMPIGVLQYHLSLLVNGGLISAYSDGRYKRYFESRKFTETEVKAISILRHETAGRILVTLVEKQCALHKELAVQLGISSQALSWQMNRLEEMGVIRKKAEGLEVKYTLDCEIRNAVQRFVSLV